jgi:hypothetical protein
MIENFEKWKAVRESESNEELNEIFGLSKLFKSFFKSLSEPMKKKVELLTKNIDNKTGKVKDAKELVNDLVSTFKSIADDKKADLKGMDTPEDIKTVIKEFILEIKAVFAASRVPYSAMIESEINEEDSALNEDLKSDFIDVMKSDDSDFEEMLEMWLDDWASSNGGDDVKSLEKAAIKMIDTMMKTFQKKIEGFGTERLEKLIALTSKNTNPKKSEIDSILKAKKDASKEVETPEGKQEFLDTIKDELKNIEVLKTKNADGSYDVTFKSVKL